MKYLRLAGVLLPWLLVLGSEVFLWRLRQLDEEMR